MQLEEIFLLVQLILFLEGILEGRICFGHNSSKSTNFGAIEVVPNAARGDLAVGATTPLEDFDVEISRERVRRLRAAGEYGWAPGRRASPIHVQAGVLHVPGLGSDCSTCFDHNSSKSTNF